jgi:exonuclease III
MMFNINLKILSWNVHGICKVNKCALVKDFVVDSKCEILCLQETKWSEHSIFRVKKVCPHKFTDYIILDAQETRGGILTAWHAKYKCEMRRK